MTQNTTPRLSSLDVHGQQLPTPEEGLADARRRLVRTFQRGERVWLADTRYDPVLPGWLIDIVRQGATGSWVRQRYLFDEAAQILHFRGESALSDAEFRLARREGAPLPTGE